MRFWFSGSKKKPNIVEVSVAQRAALLKQEQQVVDEIVSAYKIAEQGIQRELNRLLLRWEQALEDGDEVSEAWLYQKMRLNELLRVIHTRIGEFANEAADITRKAQLARSIQAGVNISEQVKSARIKTGFDMLHEEAIRDIAGFLADGKPLAELFDAIAPHAVLAAKTAFIEGVAIGRNPRVIARALMKGIGADEGGIPRVSRTRSILIARTETMRAYRVATTRNYLANKSIIRGWIWMSARDPRTCPICLGMDGTVHPVGEQMHTHPGCRCFQVPKLADDIDFDMGTGQEWFDKLSSKERLDVMKGSKARLELADSGVSLRDMVAETHSEKWGPGVRLKTLTELRK